MTGNAVRTLLVCGLLSVASVAQAAQTVWRFDDLHRIGGARVLADGAPKVGHGPNGAALEFDGVADSVLIDRNPLTGAKAFTIEAIFRPDGGAFEQRFLHMAETDPATGLDAQPARPGGDPNPRVMFEIRVVGDSWYLDGFVKSAAGSKTLALPDHLHKIGRWYAVAQSYDGTTYRTYVDGVLQGEAEMAFTPQRAGHVRVGARMNKVNYFHGAIAKLRVSDRALTPGRLLTAAN